MARALAEFVFYQALRRAAPITVFCMGEKGKADAELLLRVGSDGWNFPVEPIRTSNFPTNIGNPAES